MTFKTWLKKQKNNHSPIGDFARDTCRDAQFPECEEVCVYYQYLESHNACIACIDAFEQAWNEYMKQKEEAYDLS